MGFVSLTNGQLTSTGKAMSNDKTKVMGVQELFDFLETVERALAEVELSYVSSEVEEYKETLRQTLMLRVLEKVRQLSAENDK